MSSWPCQVKKLEELSQQVTWSVYRPASTAQQTIPNPNSTNSFNRTILKPFSKEELAQPVLDRAFTVGLGDYRYPDFTSNAGADGQSTSFGGVLSALDDMLSMPAREDMIQELRDNGGMAAMKQDFQSRTETTVPAVLAVVPEGQARKKRKKKESCMPWNEQWNGDESTITVRHCVGNLLYAYFEGLDYVTEEGEIGVFKLRIGT